MLRWGDERAPGQILRILNLAKHALASRGITDFASHVIVIGAPARTQDYTIGEVLVSRAPFSPADIEAISAFAQHENYRVYWLKGVSEKEPFASLIRGDSMVDPGLPTDDCPFFFTPVKADLDEHDLSKPAHASGMILLGFTFLFALVLVVLTILLPVWRAFSGTIPSTICTSAAYFCSIGLGFMFVEVAQIERMIVLLGNPSYGLSVVLLTILVCSALGSAAFELARSKLHEQRLLITSAILTSIFVAGSAQLSAHTTAQLASYPVTSRITAAAAFVGFPAFFMGWAFPAGLSVFIRAMRGGGAWFWAVNGAASVLGSILAAILSITIGITNTLLIGAAMYLIAPLVVFVKTAQTKHT